MDGINSTSSTPYVNPVGNTQPTSGVAPTTSTPPIGYNPDAFATSNTYGAVQSQPTSYPMSQVIFEQPSLASSFSRFFIDSSDKFLKMGSNWMGKAVLNLMAGNIPIFTSSAASQQISNNINTWLGRSDLIRAGLNPYQALLMQDVGVRNMTDLAALRNPQDQSTLAQMITAASQNRGQPIMVLPASVSAWVNNAQQLPKYF